MDKQDWIIIGLLLILGVILIIIFRQPPAPVVPEWEVVSINCTLEQLNNGASCNLSNLGV